MSNIPKLPGFLRRTKEVNTKFGKPWKASGEDFPELHAQLLHSNGIQPTPKELSAAAQARKLREARKAR